MKRRTVTATDEQGQRIRISLGAPEWAGKENAGTGVWLTGLWFGQHRILAEFDSIWEDCRHPGRCQGTYYEVIADPEEIIQLCDLAGIESPAFVLVEDV
jgi:hypothetical protein